ncbi:unnamed protein product [Schistosoma turkestanicum]|nr:unnamed protein product [Schistosoma turkestanicum]
MTRTNVTQLCWLSDENFTTLQSLDNCLAYKIHCSETTHAILDRLGGFTFEKRGTITVKGKGDMQTWWITGRTRADLAKDCCPLPLNWKKRLKKVEAPAPGENQPET